LEPWRSSKPIYETNPYSCVATIPETNIAPARKTSQKETSFPTLPFSGAMFVSGEGKAKMGLADWHRYKSDRRAQWRNPYSSKLTYVVVSNILYFHPYPGKIPNLTDIFQMG